MAIIAEEFGFVGVAVIVLLFAFSGVAHSRSRHQSAKLERLYQVARGGASRSDWRAVGDQYRRGITGLLPTKGLSLLLLTGGSGIVANLLAVMSCCASIMRITDASGTADERAHSS